MATNSNIIITSQIDDDLCMDTAMTVNTEPSQVPNGKTEARTRPSSTVSNKKFLAPVQKPGKKASVANPPTPDRRGGHKGQRPATDSEVESEAQKRLAQFSVHTNSRDLMAPFLLI